MAPTHGPDVLGVEHCHDYSVPWRGLYACRRLTCAAVATADLDKPTSEDAAILIAAIRGQYR